MLNAKAQKQLQQQQKCQQQQQKTPKKQQQKTNKNKYKNNNHNKTTFMVCDTIEINLVSSGIGICIWYYYQ